MADDKRIDLRALDPDAVPGAEEQFVGAVMARVAGRSPRTADDIYVDPFVGVWSLMRSPALAAGIVIAVVIGAWSLRAQRPAESVPQTVAQAVGVPEEFFASGAATPPSDSR